MIKNPGTAKGTAGRTTPVLRSAAELGVAGFVLSLAIVLQIGGVESPTVARFLVVIFGLCSVLLSVSAVRTHLRQGRFGRLVLIVGFAFWFGIPALVSVTSGSYTEMSDSAPGLITQVVFNLSLFICIALIVNGLLGRRYLRSLGALPLPSATPGQVGFVALGATIVGLTPYLVLGNSVEEVLYRILLSRSVEKDWQHVENLGSEVSPFLVLATAVLIAGIMLLWVVVRQRDLPRPARLLVAMWATLLTTIVYLDHGTRALMALALMPALAMWVHSNWSKRGMIPTLSLLTVGATALGLLQFQVAYRSLTSRLNWKEYVVSNWATLGGTTDFFSETAFALSLVPEKHDFFRESLIVQFLVAPIPRFVWPEKPVSEVVRYYTLERWDLDILISAGNTFPGVVGQFYMSRGLLGTVLAGATFGILAAILDLRLGQSALKENPFGSAVVIMAVTWLGISFRVMSPGYLYAVLAATLIVLTARWLPRPGSRYR